MTEQHQPTVAELKTEALRAYIDSKEAEKFRTDQGASACGIGQDANGEPCLNLYIDHARPAVSKQVRPKTIPLTHAGKKFDVAIREVQSGGVRLDGGGPNQPLLVAGGEGVGVKGDASGTLGGWAWDNVKHRLVFLSACHVLGGDDGDIVLWLSPPNELLSRAFGKTIRGQKVLDGKPKVDCAIGFAEQPNGAVLEVVGLGAAIMETGTVNAGDRVVKFGNATERTHGTIFDAHVTGGFQDATDPSQMRAFAECFLINPTNTEKGWAKAGDSGSLVLSETPNERGVREVIGMHIATLAPGTPHEQGVACRIENVFRALSITTLPIGVLEAIVASAVGFGKEGKDMMTVLQDFRDQCTTSDAGKRVLEVIEKNRTALVTLLAARADLRDAAGGVFRSVFANADGAGPAMHRSMDVPTVQGIRDLGTLLAAAAQELQTRLDGAGNQSGTAGRDLRSAIEACLNDLPPVPESTSLDAIIHPHNAVPAGAHSN